MDNKEDAEKSIQLALHLCEQYLKQPEKLCRERQLTKLQKKFKLFERKYNYSREEMFDELIRLAKLRTLSNPINVFLVNAGSSGSHWIEAMLDEIDGIISLNEVYFSKELRLEMKELDTIGKQMVMNLVHLCHSPILSDDAASAIFINSAHTKGTRFYRSIEPECKCILLVRDPLSIVISRTFRKEKFRQSIASDHTDSEFFNKNLEVVKRWYERNLASEFDLICKYESFVEDGKNELNKILILLDLECSDEKLEEIIFTHNRENILSKKSENKANLYTGKIKPVQKNLNDLAIEALKHIRSELEYKNKSF